MEYEVENAIIDYTHLGVSHTDHGILSFIIGIDYGGAGQGYGQITLDTYDETRKKRMPTILASSLLLAIDEMWGKDWEDLKGIPCRSYHTWGNIRALGHYLKDRWLWFNGETLEFKVTKFKDIKAEGKDNE